MEAQLINKFQIKKKLNNNVTLESYFFYLTREANFVDGFRINGFYFFPFIENEKR